MHLIPRFFSPSNRNNRMNLKKKQTRPRLDRRNAAKNIEYDASSSSSFDSSLSSSAPSSLHTRSLDLYDRMSFRVQGVEGDFDIICRSLGLTPEDFSIPTAVWEARKGRSSSDILPKSKLYQLDSPDSSKREDEIETKDIEVTVDELSDRVVDDFFIGDRTELTRFESPETSECCIASSVESCGGGVGARGGIKGARPPLLKPPPSMRLPVIDNGCSTWDILRDFAPDDEKDSLSMVHERYGSSDENEQDNFEDAEHPREQEEEQEQVVEGQEETSRVGLVENGALYESGFSTSNDDDTSSSTTEPPSNISPKLRLRRMITNWQKGDLLGRGSYGSVYEGISEDGFFFAVKEVSLLDQGTQGRQSVYQLEQEITLLSKFEHENIVQYHGTDKDDSNLYIFLELVTKGSLQSLYQRYILWDLQVSAYTRQILHGLKYLHDQNVVHRDIKCANILVDVSGSVKLADFGLAKATTLNDVKSCKGTPFWMAPEVVNGRGQGYGIAADIWSLGCTVLEMLTRKIPYSEFGAMPALYKIGNGEPPSVPEDLSRDACDFILQCTQVNPNHRPTATKLLNHPFIRMSVSTSSGPAFPYHSGGRS